MTIDIAQTFRSMLLADADVSAIVETRVYTDFFPQGASTPSIVLWANAETAMEHLTGPLGLDQAFMRVNCYASIRRAVAVDLAAKVWQATAGFRGVFDATHVIGVSRRTGISHSMDRPSDGTDERRFVAVQDFLVSYHSLCEV